MMQHGNMLRIPFQIACAASFFGGALYFRWWLKQPLTLIYNEKLEKASNFDLDSYFNKVEKRLIKVINRNLKIRKFLLHTSYDDKYESQVTSLIRYAVRSEVEELDLSFWLKCGPYVKLVHSRVEAKGSCKEDSSYEYIEDLSMLLM
ncbi:hypothetical protein Tco_0961192 [Tanacetum coccineum]